MNNRSFHIIVVKDNSNFVRDLLRIATNKDEKAKRCGRLGHNIDKNNRKVRIGGPRLRHSKDKESKRCGLVVLGLDTTEKKMQVGGLDFDTTWMRKVKGAG